MEKLTAERFNKEEKIFIAALQGSGARQRKVLLRRTIYYCFCFVLDCGVVIFIISPVIQCQLFIVLISAVYNVISCSECACLYKVN